MLVKKTMALTKKNLSTEIRRFPSKRLVITGLAIILLTAGIGAYFYKHHLDTTKKVTLTSGTSGSSVNLNPPTLQDKADNQQHKDNIVKDQTSPTPIISSGKKQASVLISYMDKTTVDAYATGVFEDGGTCTATLTQGSQTVTRTSTGFQNASYTQCAPISLADANLGGGAWTVIVSYSSATAAGKSGSSTLKL
jgi:hypothetical protein